MNRLVLTVLALAVLPISGLAKDAPVTALRGEFLKTGEVIIGALVPDESGGGSVYLQFSTLAGCRGNYQMAAATSGRAKFQCNDSRSGDFWFVIEGDGGIGCGVAMPASQVFRVVVGEVAFSPGFPHGHSCGQ